MLIYYSFFYFTTFSILTSSKKNILYFVNLLPDYEQNKWDVPFSRQTTAMNSTNFLDLNKKNFNQSSEGTLALSFSVKTVQVYKCTFLEKNIFSKFCYRYKNWLRICHVFASCSTVLAGYQNHAQKFF